MRVGISCFVTDRSVSVTDLAREAEVRGFTELWLPEHTHIPTGRDTEWPMQEGAELPEMYKRSLDPFVALTAAAMATTTITLGTGICLVAQHDPIVLAKTVATLDHLCRGRLVFGVGFGWNEDEMRHHGVDPDRRRTIGREKTLAMKQLWTNDEASFDGRYVRFADSWQWPKPVQRPHPPIWVGGGKATMKHAVEWGDGWMPIEGVMPVARMARTIRSMVAEGGRADDPFTVYVAGVAPDAERLDEYAGAGVDGVAFSVTWDADLDTVKRELDDHAAFRDRHL